MYCINCGVKLGEAEKSCPLCKTRVFHPDIPPSECEALYPENKYPKSDGSSHLPQFVLTFTFLLPAIVVLLCDLKIYYAITWSGYVVGALVTTYVISILPTWFKKPNPVIFLPCDFLVIGLFLLYINHATDGNWFLSFAFPVIAAVGIIVSAVAALLHYTKKGRLFIIGGAITALGLFMLPMEFLLNITLDIQGFLGWSLYPLVALVLLGLFLIFLGIYSPAREAMERKFFF